MRVYLYEVKPRERAVSRSVFFPFFFVSLIGTFRRRRYSYCATTWRTYTKQLSGKEAPAVVVPEYRLEKKPHSRLFESRIITIELEIFAFTIFSPLYVFYILIGPFQFVRRTVGTNPAANDGLYTYNRYALDEFPSDDFERIFFIYFHLLNDSLFPFKCISPPFVPRWY